MEVELKKYQEDVYKLITNTHKKNRLVHTYLFHGPRGSMKYEASKYFASLVLCENENACGKCSECVSIQKEQNPNVFLLEPIGESIRKAQILDLAKEFSLKSDSKRVFIIKDIDKATAASANSLLKFLEETNENCYGILLTENIDSVLLTIKSRSQIVNFRPINRNIIFQQMIENNINQGDALVISTLTNSFNEAIGLSNDEVLLNIIKLAKKIIISFENDNDAIIIMGTEGKFLYRESKEYHRYFLNILINMQNDKIKLLLSNDNIFKKFINHNSITLPLKTQIKILEILMEINKKIRYNLNMELTYLQMLISIARCIDG